MELPSLLKLQREKLGLTQAQISQLSGVSLPTIQLIEAGRGNPSLRVLEPLLKSVGLKLIPKRKDTEWDVLCYMGLPIGEPFKRLHGSFTFERFAMAIKHGCLEMLESPEPRRIEALTAMIFTIRKHFPKWFSRYLEKSPVVGELMGRKLDGRILKLSRAVLPSLARHL